MERIKDGGPAYPQAVVDHSGEARALSLYDGMSLRDYFAAHALAGMLADECTREVGCPKIAENAYKYADAMIAERKAKS